MEVRIERSAARHKTVSVRPKDGVLVVSAPQAMSDEELAPIIARLQKRVENRTTKASLDDADLQRRAQELSRAYFDDRLRPKSVRWVTNQNVTRWASCTHETQEIRVSHRLASVPSFVLDAVLVHELAHLAVPHHGPEFWALANRFPKMERARGYLMALGGEEAEAAM